VRPDGKIDTTGGLYQTTDSTDIQFAPHPSAMVFTKMDDQLVVACLGLPQGYGLRLQSSKPYVFSAFDFIVGEGAFPVCAGETVETPTFFIGYCCNSDPHEGFKCYTRELVRRGDISSLDSQHAPDWWFAPYYGTWGDQVYFASTPGEGMNWGGGDTMGTGTAVRAAKTPQNIFREALVDRALEIIRDERLPIGIVGVDDGWQIGLGDWQPHPERVRDMRALVERIHAAGLKAALWWVPFDIAPDAQLLHEHPEWFSPSEAPIAAKYRNVWQQPFLDYSNPRIQEEYLFPLLQRIFGQGADDWNYDGLKLDFNALKIFPNMTFYDRDWHGEECYLYRATRLIYQKIKEIRPDAWIMGCTAHPYFSMAQDFCRMYDIHNSDYRAHRERGRMVSALTVGNYLTYDFHFSRERFEGYLQQCQEDGVAMQIGSLLGFPSGCIPLEASDFDLMRRYLVPGLRRAT
ncbi:MAG TPA: alpha-galactosidase, partial [Armatimonadota bacterium]